MDSDRLLALRARLQNASSANLKASEEEHRRQEMLKPKPPALVANKPPGDKVVRAKALADGPPAAEALTSVIDHLPSASADAGSHHDAKRKRKDAGVSQEEEATRAKRPKMASENNEEEPPEVKATAPVHSFETAATAHGKLSAQHRKEENKVASYGSSVHNEDAQHRSYSKEMRSTIGTASSGASSLPLGETGEAFADETGLDRLSSHLIKVDEARRKAVAKEKAKVMEAASSGASATAGNGHISAGNAKFNQGLSKSLDKYTGVLRQAIERGSAI
jgi:hypothetical protein